MSLAAALDVLISVAAVRLRSGEAAFLASPNAMTEANVSFRFVKERRIDAAELVEGASRAYRVSTYIDALFAAAATRCGRRDAAVRQTSAGSVTLGRSRRVEGIASGRATRDTVIAWLRDRTIEES